MFTIGCDPEVFVKKNKKFVSAYGLIPGTKDNPFRVKQGAVQVDGMALEFNTDPASNENAFVLNVNSVLEQMKAMVPGYEVVAVPVAKFTEAYMKQQPKEAVELGCTPDFNGWTGLVNDKPDQHKPMRTASGHVHIGWTSGTKNLEDPKHIHRCNLAGRQMDFYLGLGSLFYDDDTERREMYGKGGCIRYKPYGVEYRTLSNAWLNSEQRMRWVFRNAVKGMQDLVSGKILAETYGDIQSIINTSDKKEAKKIIDRAGLEVCNG
jgi:hypothetical protein